VSYPKIELHVHIEATLKPERLLEIAWRNDYPLPVDTVDDLRHLYESATLTTSSTSGSS
jgi:aminodeoxyfutalosine deaminase